MKPGTASALPGAPLKPVLLAGAVGGLAEILWVALYASVNPLRGMDVAREVTVAVFGSPVGGIYAGALGILIHMVLALAVAAAFVAVLWQPLHRLGGGLGVVAGSVAALAAIWTINFFVLLPAIHPAFVGLMPLPVTLASKILFGIGMGYVLACAGDVSAVRSVQVQRAA